MARLFIDGFNSGDGSLWDYSNFPTPTANRPGFGSYCVNKNGIVYARKIFGTKSEIYLKLRFELASVVSSMPILAFRSGGGFISKLMVATTTFIPSFVTDNADSNAGTTRATSATGFALGRVYLVEIYFKPLNSGSGRFTLKVDGTTWIDWTGISTYGTESVDELQLGNTSSSAPQFYASDVVIDDANWIGNSRVGYKLVNGAGQYTEMTPSGAASNFQNVDEQTPSASDFNWSNTDEQKDMFTLGTLQVGTAGYSVNSIKAVQIQAMAKYTGSPTPTVLKTGVRISTTDDWKGTATPGTSSGPVSNIWETNPATSNPWGTTDDFQAGVKVT